MSEQHSTVVGGSTAGLRIKCPASLITTQGLPPEPSSDAALRGTALHHIVERCIDEDLSDGEINERFSDVVVEDVFIEQAWIEDKIFPAYDYFCEVVSEDAEFSLEGRVNFNGTIDGAFGTADVIFVDGDRCGIIDWKFGDNWIVRAEDNPQGKFYLAAAIHCGALPKMAEYEFHIFQPAAKLKHEEYASVAVFTYEELETFRDELVVAIQNGMSESPTYNEGEHCRYCKGRLNCPAYKEMLAGIKRSDVLGMDGDDFAFWKSRIPSIKDFIKDVEAAALRNAKQGVHIPGFRLEASQSDRMWVDADAVEGVLSRAGLKKDERFVSKLVSPAQAEKALRAADVDPAKVAKIMKKHVTRETRGERLSPVPENEDYSGAGDNAQTASALMNI